MRRPIALCACALALITGAWFGQAYTLLAPSGPISVIDQSPRGATATAWRLYDAIDHLFITGDDAALRAVIAPDFVDHVDTPRALANRDGFLDYLAALRTSNPTLRLVHHDVIAQNDRAVAQITIEGDTEDGVMDIPVDGAPPWPEVEIIRIEGDRIVERWGGPAGYALSTTLFSETLTASVRGDVLPYLRRVTFAPGASDSGLDRMDPAIVLVESGEIEADTPGEGGASSPAANQTLGPGSTLVITEKVDIELHNRTDAPAVVLLLSLAQPRNPNRSGLDTRQVAYDSGITIQSLAGNDTVKVTHPGGKVTAELAQITLAPGTHLSPHPIGGVEFVVIEDGTLTLTADGALFTAWLRGPNGRSVFPGPYAEMAEGHGLSISGLVNVEGEVLTGYRNESDNPVTFLFLRLTPS